MEAAEELTQRKEGNSNTAQTSLIYHRSECLHIVSKSMQLDELIFYFSAMKEWKQKINKLHNQDFISQSNHTQQFYDCGSSHNKQISLPAKTRS